MLPKAAVCLMADMIGEYEKGGLPIEAQRSILDVYDALVEMNYPGIESYTQQVDDIRENFEEGDDEEEQDRRDRKNNLYGPDEGELR